MRKHWLDLVLLSLSIGSLLASLIISYAHCDASWFGRSGSLAVLFAVMLEFRQSLFISNVISKAVNNQAFVGGGFFSANIPPIRKNFQAIGYFIIVVGTIIWGYGDLLQVC